MKNINLNSKNKDLFTVDKNQINNSNALLPYVLYKKMEQFAVYSTISFHEYKTSKPTLTKLNILKNAFLNDNLQLKSYIKKLNEKELQLSIEVIKNFEDNSDVICNALFSFSLENFTLNQVS